MVSTECPLEGRATRMKEDWEIKTKATQTLQSHFKPTQIPEVPFQKVLFMPWQKLGVGLGSQYSDACGFLSLQK